MSLPQDIQVPVAMTIGLLGFLIALGAILYSKNKQGAKTKVAFDAVSTPKASDSPSTPPKKESVSTPTDQNTGSIQTPAGRRSARLAKRRKED